MAAVVAVPSLGREMAGGVVAEWYRPDGANVDVGEVVCRLECDFVAVEVEAESPGILRHRRPAGSIERPGAILAVLLAPGESMPSEDSLKDHAHSAEEPEAIAAEPLAEPESVTATGDEPYVETASVHAPGEPIVVPFRRRATDRLEHSDSWEGVPGDSAGFESSLFDGPPQADPLLEPGTSIPGLPLWDSDDHPRGSFAEADAEFEASYGTDYEPSLEPEFEPGGRFARIVAEAAISTQVLTMHVRANATQASRAVRVFTREWRGFGASPLMEDIVLMAAAKALEERRLDSSPAGLVIGDHESEVSVAISEPLGRDIRELAAARESGGDETFERAAWVLVSLAPLGIEAVQPRLPAGMAVALGMGAVADGNVTLTLSFDSSLLAETEAGRLLARIRHLVEEPYGLFA